MILWTTHRFIRYSLRLFVSILFANVNASMNLDYPTFNYLTSRLSEQKIATDFFWLSEL